jgi:two-component system, NtrC family, sensor kinase
VIARGRKILYVDDDEANLTTFQYCFADRFDVLVAHSAVEALTLLAAEPVAVLLSDQRMPLTTGVELCAIVKKRFPAVVRMIVTAYADIEAIVAAINSGEVSRYILKPWTEERMTEELYVGLRAFDLAQLIRESHASLLRVDRQNGLASLLAEEVHEIASPLTSLCSGLRLARNLAENLSGQLAAGPQQARETAGDLKEAFDTALLVADELSARVELYKQGETTPPSGRRVTDLNQAVEAAVAIVGPQLLQDVDLEVQLGDVPPVAAPPTRVCQVVANLLTNAIEALEPAPARQHRVTIITADSGDRVLVEIHDTGRGMSTDALAHLFEPFVSTKTAGDPRGLGLTVVRRILRRMDGDISITSEVGRGTCVTVELPAARSLSPLRTDATAAPGEA